MATAKQIKANQKNGQKGGVKSRKGKSISKMNALKHGIFSNSILLNGDFAEEPSELEELRNELFDDLQPVGALEKLLADKIIVGFWKLKRFLRAERGLLQQNENGFLRLKDEERLLVALDVYENLPTRYQMLKDKNQFVVVRTIAVFGQIKEAFLITGYLGSMNFNLLYDYFDKNKLYPRCEKLDGLEEALGLNSKQDVNREEAKKELLKLIDNEITELKEILETVKEMAEEEDKSNLDSMLIPYELELNRLHRYETQINNQINRDLEQFQSLQLVRRSKKNKKMGSFRKMMYN